MRVRCDEDRTGVRVISVSVRISCGRSIFIRFLFQIINQFLLFFQAQCLDVIEFFVFSLQLGEWEVPEGLQKR